MEREFVFQPENRKEQKDRQGNTIIRIVGSRENSSKENLQEFGRVLAESITEQVEVAKKENKKLVFDMATGSTPEKAWPMLQKKVKEGLDLSNVIVIGHEEAWGTYNKGSHSDFDHYRKIKFFEENNLPVKEIKSVEGVTGSVIDGNFVPMHLDEDIEIAAEKYRKILKGLQERDDVTFFGLYGVGVDGHIGEIQVGALGIKETMKRKESYVSQKEDYSFESKKAQLFRWRDKGGDFRPEDNVFWMRERKGEEVGRAVKEDYGGMEAILGLGWKDMLRLDKMTIAFNNKNKQLAFELAVEGSMSGKILGKEKELGIKREKGEGESILSDLEEFAEKLVKDGILKKDTFEDIKQSGESLRCGDFFRAIYQALDEKETVVDDPKKYYQNVWTLINRYVGKRAPVSMLIRLREFLGKKTEIVVTPEVVEGTRYEDLYNQ